MERISPSRDRHFMRNALNISLRGIGNTWPNPSVGAVVVKNNQINIDKYIEKEKEKEKETEKEKKN